MALKMLSIIAVTFGCLSMVGIGIALIKFVDMQSNRELQSLTVVLILSSAIIIIIGQILCVILREDNRKYSKIVVIMSIAIVIGLGVSSVFVGHIIGGIGADKDITPHIESLDASLKHLTVFEGHSSGLSIVLGSIKGAIVAQLILAAIKSVKLITESSYGQVLTRIANLFKRETNNSNGNAIPLNDVN